MTIQQDVILFFFRIEDIARHLAALIWPGQNIVEVEEVPTQDIMNILDMDQEHGIFDESGSSTQEYMDTEEEIEMAIDEAIDG